MRMISSMAINNETAKNSDPRNFPDDFHYGRANFVQTHHSNLAAWKGQRNQEESISFS